MKKRIAPLLASVLRKAVLVTAILCVSCRSSPDPDLFVALSGVNEIRLSVYVDRNVGASRQRKLEKAITASVVTALAPRRIVDKNSGPYLSISVSVEAHPVNECRQFAYALQGSITDRVEVTRSGSRQPAYGALWSYVVVDSANDSDLEERLALRVEGMLLRLTKGSVDHGPAQPELVPYSPRWN